LRKGQPEYSWGTRGVRSNPFRFLAGCLKVETETETIAGLGPYIVTNLEPAIPPHVIGQRGAGGKSGVPHRIFAISRVPGRGSGVVGTWGSNRIGERGCPKQDVKLLTPGEGLRPQSCSEEQLREFLKGQLGKRKSRYPKKIKGKRDVLRTRPKREGSCPQQDTKRL
jgi:hypothetical protein